MLRRLFVVLALVAAGLAQNNSQAPESLTTLKLNIPLLTPPVASGSGGAQVVGNPGPQTYYYWVVSQFPVGASSPAGPFLASQVPNTLTVSNYVSVFWQPVAGATSYDLLRTTTPSAPSGTCACAVSTGLTAPAANDQSNSLNAYVVNPFDASVLGLSLTNEVTGSGASHLYLRQNGVLVADLSTPAVTPGGANGSCQYNHAGALGGILNCNSDGTNLLGFTTTGTITAALGTQIADNPFFNGSTNLNNAAVDFNGFVIRYNVTAAGGGTLLLSVYGGVAGTTPLFTVDQNGNVVAAGTGSFGGSNGAISLVEGTCPSGVTNSDILCSDSGIHRLKANNNNGGASAVALFSDNLGSFASTTSAQLAGVISDETGSGALVFGTSPTISNLTVTGSCSGCGAATVLYFFRTTGTGSPADATTYYVGDRAANGIATVYSQAQFQIYATCTVQKVYVHTTNESGTVGSSETVTYSLRKNNTTDSSTGTTTWDMATNTGTDATFSPAFAVTAGDTIVLKIVTPTWVTNPTGIAVAGWFACN